MLVLLMRKARRRGDLVPIKKQVTRDGRTFTQTVWVSPNKERHNGKLRAQTENTREKRGGHFISPQKFKAGEWCKQFVDPQATPDQAGVKYILKNFGKDGADIARKIEWAIDENKKLAYNHQLTYEKYRTSGEGEDARYTPERESLHGRIIQDILSPDKIRMAKPEPGKKPTLIMLGGRGGSGKSWFKGNLYNPDKFVVLDADSIKEQLKPEYAGWNAFQVHEESSDVLEQAIKTCVDLELNVVLDITMKTPKSAIERINKFKEKGYRTEAHYMHVPPQEAAKRAIGRYRGDDGEYRGRFVPVDTILKMTENEKSFDQVKELVDDWSFRDNNVKRGEKPILISQKRGNKGVLALRKHGK